MAVLQKQPVTVTLKGLNQKAPGTIGAAGTLEIADNLRIARDDQGNFELVRRNGLTEIADTTTGSGYRLGAFGGSVFAQSASDPERYSSATAKFETVPAGGFGAAQSFRPIQVGRSDLQMPFKAAAGAQTPSQSSLDVAYVQRTACYAWVDESGASRYLIRDSATGVTLASGNVVASGATNTKIVALGSTFFLFWKAANAIVATTISATSPFTAAGSTTVVAAGSAFAGTDYDIQTGFDATHIALMYRSDATHHVRALLTTAFAVSTSVTDAVAADQPDVAMCWFPQDTFGASLYYATANAANGVKTQTIDKATLAITATITDGGAFAATATNMTGAVVSGVPLWVLTLPGGSGHSFDVSTGMSGSSSLSYLGLVSRAFYLGGIAYAVVSYNSDSSAPVLQDTYFVMELRTGHIQGKILPSQARRAANHSLSSVIIDPSGVAHFLGGLVVSDQSSTGASLVTQYGLSDLSVTLQSKAVGPPVAFGGVLLSPGGQLLEIDNDGTTPAHEQGFVTAPEQPTLTEGAAASGSITPGTRSYITRAKWIDSGGQVQTSTMSTPIAITTVNANSSVSVASLSPVVTQRPFVHFEIFCTPVNGDGTLYYKVTPPVFMIAGNATPPAFVDTHSEVALKTGEPFTPSESGGELENTAPPALNFIVAHKNRLFGIDAEIPTRIRFSKEYAPGTSAGFTDPFFIDTPGSDGPAYALASMDGHLIILKKETAYVVDGDFPDATGGGPAIPLPYLLPTGVGSDQPRSVIVSQLGTAFYSSLKGFWLINRSLQAQYIGGPVETAAAGQAISGASVHPTYTEIRWTSEGGTTFVLNTFETEKTGAPVWTTLSGQACVSSMSFNGDWYLLTSAGKLLKEDLTRWQDGVALNGGAFTAGTAYTTKARISDINFAGIGGLARVWRGQLLGQWYDSHKVKITLTLNHRSVAGQVFTFDATSDPDPYQLEFRLNAFEQKQTSVDVTIEDTTDFQRRAFAWTALMFSVGVKPGLYRMGQGHTMTGS